MKELSSINNVGLVQVISCSKTGSIRDDSYWISTKNSLELIELLSRNKVSLVQVSSCSDTGSIKDDPCWSSTKNRVDLIRLSKLTLKFYSFFSLFDKNSLN